MSRIGEKPIMIPSGVTVNVSAGRIVVKGSKGELVRVCHPEIEIRMEDGRLVVVARRNNLKNSALWGLWRSLVANMVEGVASGFEKKLEIEGVGYRAALEGDTLVLQVGFSHPVRVSIPAEISLKVEKNVMTVSGADKQKVGEMAARIRALKKPEPYKGKGIRYQGETIRRKAGKKAVASA
ncbi:MAG: 50S ribosomal protein L6 [Candidatus Sungbacteria bacterium]|uniref:Large ribosomal subunit protein uL6 n=1 Tax=Candidatus Sungiibacteriota bacterium TaxID=2750080 RepID=A0A932R132_9BACT|nr:50S ribosomal protein L6 [Candidatus Sungbacteria bacterium]